MQRPRRLASLRACELAGDGDMDYSSDIVVEKRGGEEPLLGAFVGYNVSTFVADDFNARRSIR
jgi:hypothetical protein